MAVLRSYFSSLSLDEITQIRISKKNKSSKEENDESKENEAEENKYKKINSSLYESLKEYTENGDDENIKKKILDFLSFLEFLKDKAKFFGITETLEYILIETGYLKNISLENNGNLKVVNLKLFLQRTEEYEKKGGNNLYNYMKYLEELKKANVDVASASIIGEKEDVVRIMTIHLSKGLEFPVVFLVNANKGTNLRDCNKEILMNDKYGIGINCFDSKLNVTYPTVIKEVMKTKIEEEVLSEELRILYVALTRAREKIYICGTINDSDKYISDIKKLEKTFRPSSNSKTISTNLLKSKRSFLSWILLAYFNGLEDANIKLDIIHFNELSGSVETEDRKIEYDKLNFSDDVLLKVKKSLEIADTNLNQEKYIISKVAASRVGINKTEQLKKEISNLNNLKPKSLEEGNITSAEKGSLIHYILQKLDFGKYGEILEKEKVKNIDETKTKILNEIEKDIKNLMEKEYIKEEYKSIDENDMHNILSFFLNNNFDEIKNAKVIEKEKRFFAKISNQELLENINKYIKEQKENAKEKGKQKEEEFDHNLEILDEDKLQITNFESGEEILVQGVIDLYYINKDNQINLIDYKTDKIRNKEKPEEYIKKKYLLQMIIYKLALEKAYNKKVENIAIYSTDLNKYISF